MDTAERNETDHLYGGHKPMSPEEFRALREPPEISSMDDAIEFIKGIIDNLGVWPETIEVLDPAEIEGALTFASGGRYIHSACAKMQVIREQVKLAIRYRHAEPRTPELAIRSDSGVIIFIWDKGIYQAA